MRSILVSHPHVAAVSKGVAAAFERHGMLAAYYGGVVGAPGSPTGAALSWAARRWPVAVNRLLEGVEPERVHSLAPVEIGARGLARLGAATGGWGPRPYDAQYVAHDAAVAALPWPDGTDAVYAYEDGALWTFRRAARRGLARIWDLPLPHYLTLERMWQEEFRRWPGAMGVGPWVEPQWKKRRKDAELALASVVSVASAFTRASLDAIGLHAPVVVTPYGFPSDEFSARGSRPEGPFTVLAVGTQDLRKGTPYLLEAWKRADLRDARLRLVGPIRLTDTFVAAYAGLFHHVPHVPRSRLAHEYRAADLVAFPTLGDGFGLVIQEAMCCGTPVLTTPCGGGPECITDGVDGWIVPARDIDALVERLREAARDRDRLFRMGQAARARAEKWTWKEAGDALVRGLLGLI
jgi:glycosyltransferase involved in cell wall biosynthesis